MRWAITGLVMCLIFVGAGCAGPAMSQRSMVEIRLAADAPQPDYLMVRIRDLRDPIYVSPVVELTEADIKEAGVVSVARKMRIVGAGEDASSSVRVDDSSGPPAVAVTFGWFAARKLGRLTEAHTGERLAILVAGQVVSAPRITGRIDKRMLIHGNFKPDDAAQLASILNRKVIRLK